MDEITFDNAFFIKLGQGGGWEESSILESKLRIGWGQLTLADINESRWDVCRDKIDRYFEGQGGATKATVTKDLNNLKLICGSTSQDIWITFHQSKLYWCRLGQSRIFKDDTSYYRKVKKWSSQDTKGDDLTVNRIPGDLSQIQGFRGVVCSVRQKETLRRVLNCQPSAEFTGIDSARQNLVTEVKQGIRKLHWKDFELFVDLLFRASGWRRVSMLGQTMKSVDLELEDQITRDKIQIQVKSRASRAEFLDFFEEFKDSNYHKLYFAVHTPSRDLLTLKPEQAPGAELILPEQLAQMAVDLGMIDWLIQRIR